MIPTKILMTIASASVLMAETHALTPRQGQILFKVPANAAWTDTGLDVGAGDMIHFAASGNVSLQRGNPEAFCGPQGLDMQTLQQPLTDKNLGALIGKVVRLISVEVDEETKEEIRNELVEIFFLGAENSVDIPLEGRLHLGINELVVEDNLGEFEVTMTLEKRRSQDPGSCP